MLKEDRSYFLLGAESDATDLFTLTLQIISGNKLQTVLPPLDQLGASQFHYAFDLFGHGMKTAPFSNLENSDMDVETIEVKVASNARDVLDYFKNEAKPVEIFLVNGEKSFAVATVDTSRVLGLKGIDPRQELHLEKNAVVPFKALNGDGSNSSEAVLNFSLELKRVRPLMPTETNAKDSTQEANNNNLSMHTLAGASSSSVLAQNRAWKEKLEHAVVDVEEWKLQQKKKFLTKVWAFLFYK